LKTESHEEHLHPRQKVSGGWRALHSEELLKSYASANVTRLINQMKDDVIGEGSLSMGKSIIIVVGEPEGKIKSGRPRIR
jgi:hypothetical protein